ncbi:hypothetical protein LTR62_006157 [Meristemomyces frigidus]|uniref:DUF125-domain-containing protein n=1 Tax=Meristemomyces frigidus TaxID=1508187 RepID=A0AAN7YN50_9PEZI|nr:hypothetical protein LTR62_006157 [Meristemomyces frigidus]
MAALFIKSLLFSAEKGSRYSRLPTGHGTTTQELETGTRRSSTDSAIAMSETSLNNEKVIAQIHPPTRLNPRIISDATIGLSDGLTVPFALTAGLSALGDTQVVIYAGLAELIAGGISMGLGGYLGAKGEAEAYQAALAETKVMVAEDPQTAARLVKGAFSHYDFEEVAMGSLVGSLMASPQDLVDFLMRFHHRLAEADYAPARAYVSGLTIAVGYILGGLVALLPYLFLSDIGQAFYWSVLLMALALFAFGWTKTSLIGEASRTACFRNGMQMLVLGAVAAGAAMGCVKAIN